MNIIFCILIFIMGTVFGSFFTLAVYRIPLGLNITHERSFCPNCNHKLSFKDLIPIFSYISLKGRCRYCGEKVRIRYLILEVFSGIVFLIAYLSFNINFPFFTIEKIIDFIAFICFFVTVVLISGIDKENVKIEKRVLLFGIITQALYMLYLYTFDMSNIYRYEMYLVIMLILFTIDTISLKIKGKSTYLIQILMFIDYILMYIPFDIYYMLIILSIFYVIVYTLYKSFKLNMKNNPNILFDNEKLNVGVRILYRCSFNYNRISK